MCRVYPAARVGAVEETRGEDEPPSLCDAPQLQLRLRQRFFPALLPATSHYRWR